MSPAEVASYLAAPRTMIVATHGPGGFPHQVVVFYVMDGRRPAFWSYRKAQKIVNMQRDPRVSCLVEDGADYRELRGVQLAGQARISLDPAVIEDTWRRLTGKYRGPITAAELANFQRQAHKRCVVTVEVDRVISWDHRNMPPQPG
jgi:PPOX class probable F420-dependent enzyme